MNLKRALTFGVILYVIYLLAHGILAAATGRSFFFFSHSTATFVGLWLLNIPLVLYLCKWYFKQVPPTTKSGLQLAVSTMLAFVVFDGILFALSSSLVKGIDLSVAYTDWRYYATAIEVFLLVVFAGFEFDGTYTAPTEANQ